MRSPWSLRSCPAKAWYVEMRGSPGGVVGVGRTSGSVTPARDERLAHALGQLARRLVGEGQAEHLLGGDLAGADQPHHAGGHHRGLARARSGHDHLRGGRRGDAGHLLRGEGDAEELLELLGVGEMCGHAGDANGRH